MAAIALRLHAQLPLEQATEITLVLVTDFKDGADRRQPAVFQSLASAREAVPFGETRLVIASQWRAGHPQDP